MYKLFSNEGYQHSQRRHTIKKIDEIQINRLAKDICRVHGYKYYEEWSLVKTALEVISHPDNTHYLAALRRCHESGHNESYQDYLRTAKHRVTIKEGSTAR